jgi:hypothetical protein
MRKPGYYWVKDSDVWEVAYFNGYYWMITGVCGHCLDSSFKKIDENQIKR